MVKKLEVFDNLMHVSYQECVKSSVTDRLFLFLQRTVAESLRIESAYGKFFDLVIENDDMESSYKKLTHAVDKLHTEPSWVPVSWVY